MTSLEQIYEEHKNRVFNLALQYVQNREDAEEITQDVFVSIHESLSRFEGKSSLQTWIYRITINQSLDYLKKRKRKKRWAAILPLFANNSNTTIRDIPHFDHPGVILEQKESLGHLFNIINALPD